MDRGKIEHILNQFAAQSKISFSCPIGNGHINATYLAVCTNGLSYVLQEVNTHVFRQPEQLMENIIGVTEFLQKKIVQAGGDPMRETMHFLKMPDGKSLYYDAQGCWRVYHYIDGVKSYDQVERPELLYNAAKTFGRFQRMLADYPIHKLHETIPKFHDTQERYRQFEQALTSDVHYRAAQVAPEIAFVKQRRADCGILIEQLKRGALPLRVTHNDTKLNNILIDEKTDEGVCVIDLDTVMPGLSLYDFGDCIRFGASTAAEDELDLDKVEMDIGLFESFTNGYLEGVAGALTENEIAHLAISAKLLTLECGIRFLTDYLNGDTYFRINYPNHNLDRARTQLKLVADMEQKMPRMEQIVRQAQSRFTPAPVKYQAASSPFVQADVSFSV